MNPGGGKSKGSAFERTICRSLTQWISGEEKPELFWRTAGSGAAATVDMRKGKKASMHGDIMSIDPLSAWLTDVFYIECKSYKKLDILSLFVKKGTLYQFWQKLDEESKKAEKIPMLIFKWNASQVYLAMPAAMLDGLPLDLLEFMVLNIKTFNYDIAVFDFSMFIQEVDCKTLQNEMHENLKYYKRMVHGRGE